MSLVSILGGAFLYHTQVSSAMSLHLGGSLPLPHTGQLSHVPPSWGSLPLPHTGQLISLPSKTTVTTGIIWWFLCVQDGWSYYSVLGTCSFLLFTLLFFALSLFALLLFALSLFHSFALLLFCSSLFCYLLFRSKSLSLKSDCKQFTLVALKKRVTMSESLFERKEWLKWLARFLRAFRNFALKKWVICSKKNVVFFYVFHCFSPFIPFMPKSKSLPFLFAPLLFKKEWREKITLVAI